MAKQLVRAYESHELTENEQKDISNARARAVNQAWRQERAYVMEGKGTRDWTPEQQEDIIKNGRLHGYEGHHMRSISNGETYEQKMEIAEDKNNIQFLEKTSENNEHLKAHNGSTRNRTNGCYNAESGRTRDFGSDSPCPPKAKELSEPVAQKERDSHVDQYGVDMSKAEKKTEQSKSIGKTK